MKKPVSFSDLVSQSGGKITVPESAKKPQNRDIYAELLHSIKSNGEAIISLANAIKSKESQQVTVSLPQQKKQISLEVTMDRDEDGYAKKYHIKGTV